MKKQVTAVTMDNPTTFDTLVGTFVGAHGVQGALKFKPATPTAAGMILGTRTGAFAVMIGKSPTDAVEHKVIKVKQQAASSICLVHLEGVTRRDTATAFISQSLYLPSSFRAPLDTDEYFVEDLIGLDVVTTSGRSLGKVANVLQEPANDVYETDLGALIPAVKAFVHSVEVSAGRIVVADVDGLLPDAPPKTDDEGEDAADASALQRISKRKFGAKR
jgi:16S rRNA processing protein RimM